MTITMKLLLTLLTILALSGCASTPKYGSFANQQQVEQAILADALEMLAVTYPPASSSFALQQPTPDLFGSGLVIGMRDRGYALHEWHPAPGKGDNASSAGTTTTQAPADGTVGTGTPLNYLLDNAGEPTLYRLTLLIGDQHYHRPYRQLQDGSVRSIGSWTRRQGE